MRLPLVLASAALAASAAAAEPPAADAPATEAEYCEAETSALERRARIFRDQGLSAAEIKKQNAPYEEHLAECRKRFKAELRWQAEELKTLKEISDRTPPEANELERSRVEREVRVRRAKARKRDDLSPAERKLLAEVEAAEAAQREADASARDPRLRRQLLSAERCAHGARSDRARAELAEEERLSALGGGDRTRLYFLQAELKRDTEVLARNAPELERVGGPLPCADPQVAPVARCLELEAAGREERACEQEWMQDLLRILRGQ